MLQQLFLEQLLYVGFITVFAFRGISRPAKRARYKISKSCCCTS